MLIKNGRVIDPANGIDKVCDVLIDDGKIKAVGENLPEDGQVIDASGLWVVPGLIDLHVHLREPGQEHKETIETGSLAAAKGGFTTICAMPNTSPVIDNEYMAAYVAMKAEKTAAVNVLVIGSITRGQEGLELAGIGKMAPYIIAISEDGHSVDNPALMKTAMKYAQMWNLPVFSHCEDKRLVGKGQIHQGERATRLGLAGISPDAEDVITARDILLCRSTGAKLHLCHVSTKTAVEMIRQAKADGLPVTAEVTPHHLTLTDEDIHDYDTNFKMNPPLRSKSDREALRQALKEGIIDAIATDHAPHHIDEKGQEFENAPFGIVGLETALPLSLALVHEGLLTPSQLIERMSVSPAKILGINKGNLNIGSEADLTIIDPNAEYRIDPQAFASKGQNTPFGGRKVKGRAVYTIVKGGIK